MPIDGLVSGLDTSSIIKQLMDVERAPQAALTARKATITARLDAFTSIRGKLGGLATAATALSRAADWNARSASASGDAVSVSARAGAATGSLTFTVEALAAAHSLRSGNTIATTATTIASGGTIEITDGAGAHSVSVGGGSLAEVVTAINGAGLGLRAAAVNTGSGHRLQVTAATGAAKSFSITAGLDPAVGGTVVATTGADAELTIGSGPGAYTVTSSSNTFTDLTDGLTVTARRVDATPVTVTVAEDLDALVAKVQKLVDAANGALGEVASRTAYDPGTKKAASLAGDASARRVTQELVRAVTGVVGQSALQVGGAAGVSVDRFGKVTFDAAKFRTAYAADPAAVQRLFVQGATTTGSVTFTGAGARTTEGTHAVVVTAAATAATASGLAGAFPPAAPTTVTLKVGTVEATATFGVTDTATDAAAALQAAVDAAGLQLTVSEDAGGLRVTNSARGSAAKFSVAWDGTTFTQHAGTDVAGTIGGVTATGTGDVLTAPATDPGVGGLSVSVAAGATGAVGTVSYGPGIAQRLAATVSSATESGTGFLSAAEDGGRRRIGDLDRSIAAYDIRLAARETRLRKQFSDLETALSRLRGQSDWLAGQVAGLRANNGS